MEKVNNDKMWASLIDYLHKLRKTAFGRDTLVYNLMLNVSDLTLREQGLRYNPETKEIERIEQPSEHKLVEAVANEPVEQKARFKKGDWIVID